MKVQHPAAISKLVFVCILLLVSVYARASVTLTPASGAQHLLDWPNQTLTCMNDHYKVSTIINGAVDDYVIFNGPSYLYVTLPDPTDQVQNVTYQVDLRVCNASGSSRVSIGNVTETISAAQSGVITPQAPVLAPYPNIDSSSTEVGIIGGQFRVDESGGTNYNVPLKLPSAPGGMQPPVAINYASNRGNGIMGVGWNIAGLSSITRCRQSTESHGAEAPINLTSQDRFCLDGQPLALYQKTYGAVGAKYFTEIYSGVSVTSVAGTTGRPSYFTVQKEDGSTWTYGGHSNAKLYSQHNIAMTWGVTQIEDNAGNTISYTYRKSAGSGFGENEILLDEISYGGNTINFIYNEGGNRVDTYTRYSKGAKIESKALLTSIKVKNYYNSDLVSYHFDYQRASSQSNSENTQLTKLWQCNGSRSGVCVLPDEFDYTKPGSGISSSSVTRDLSNGTVYSAFPLDYDGDGFTDWIYAYQKDANNYYIKTYRNNRGSGSTSFSNTRTFTIYAQGMTAQNFRIAPIDHDEDGIVDLLVPRQVSGVKRWYVYEYNQTSSNTGILYNENDAIADINGDGRADIVKGSSVYVNTTSGFVHKQISEGNLTTSMPNVSNPLENIEVLHPNPIDFNGDGSSEFYIKGTVYGQYPNVGGEDYYFLASIVPDGSNYQYKLNHYSEQADKALYTDINGDGLSDTFRFKSNKWEYKISTGGTSSGWQNVSLANVNNADTLQFGDIDGDGHIEVAYVDENNNTFRAYTYRDGSWIFKWNHSLPGGLSSSNSASGMADFDGDGRGDIYSMDYNSDKELHIKLSGESDIDNEVPTDKIVKFTNGFGVETDVRYLSMLADDIGGTFYQKGAPITQSWGNGSQVINVLGPMYLVREVATDSPGYDGNSYQASNEVSVLYWYEALRIQAGGRGFLGFEKLRTRDVQTDVETVTTYKQAFPYTGMPLSTTTKRFNVTLKTSTNELDEKAMRYLGSASNGRAVMPFIEFAHDNRYVVNPQATSSTFVSKTTTETRYQASGSSGSGPRYFPVSDVIVQTKKPDGTVLKELKTENTYNNDNISKWWINRVTQSKVTHTLNGSSGSPIYANFTYNPFHGMLETEITGVTGNNKLTTLHCYNSTGDKIKQLTFSEDFSQTCSSSPPSNATIKSNPLYVYRAMHYDYASGGRYVNKMTNALGIAEQSVTSANEWLQPLTIKYGVSSGDDQGLVVNAKYDDFGMKYFERDNTGKSTHIMRRLAANASQVSAPSITEPYAFVQKTSSAGSAPVFSYFDKLGRQVATAKAGFDGTTIRQFQRYDIDGRELSTVSPSYLSYMTSSRGKTLIEYDPIGRVNKVTSPDGSHVSTVSSVDGVNIRTAITTVYQLPGTSSTETTVKYEWHNLLGQLVAVDDNNDGSASAYGGAIRFYYDKQGNLDRTLDVDAIATEIPHDLYGRKKSIDDPSKGIYTFTYNAMNEVATQTASNGDVKTFYRDSLGRVVKEKNQYGTNNAYTEYVENDYTSGSVHYLAKQFEQVYKTPGNPTFTKQYHHDQFNRLTWVKTKIDTLFYVQQTTFDQYGRVFQQFDPEVEGNITGSGIGVACFDASYTQRGNCEGVQNHYNSYGYLYKQTEAKLGLSASNNNVFSRIISMDAFGNVTESENGQHITNINTFDEHTGLISTGTVKSGSTTIQSNVYKFDGIGNLRERDRLSLLSSTSQYSETYTYDDMQRMTHLDGVEQVRYHANGNIKWKKGVGSSSSNSYYCYGGTSPYAVTGTGGANCQTNSYAYDSKGNMTTGRGRIINYSYFDKATRMTKGNFITEFTYGSNRSRFKRVDTDNTNGINAKITTTYYVGNLEVVSTTTAGNTDVQTRRYIPGGIISKYENDVVEFSFMHKDHLGSINTITRGDGKITSKLAFDAWGKRYVIAKSSWSYQAKTKAAPTLDDYADILAVTPRGFTGHEHIDNMDIVHMNDEMNTS